MTVCLSLSRDPHPLTLCVVGLNSVLITVSRRIEITYVELASNINGVEQ